MVMPTTSEFIRPVLETIAQHEIIEKARRSILPLIAQKMNLTNEDMQERIEKSGKLRVYVRCDWCFTLLEKAGLIEIPHAGTVKITESGKRFLETHSGPVTRKNLIEFDLDRQNIEELLPDNSLDKQNIELENITTPEEAIAQAISQIKSVVKNELLKILMNLDPTKFEEHVLKLLAAIYGSDSVQHSGKPGDFGIDGIVTLDKFGLEKIYIQAKRWGNNIGREELHKFVGALEGQKAKKGIFISTSKFAKSALDYAESNSNSLALIDGNSLVDLMINYKIGVRCEKIISIPTIDLDYFAS